MSPDSTPGASACATCLEWIKTQMRLPSASWGFAICFTEFMSHVIELEVIPRDTRMLSSMNRSNDLRVISSTGGQLRDAEVRRHDRVFGDRACRVRDPTASTGRTYAVSVPVVASVRGRSCCG
jgi:hypothetical protein